MSTSVFLFVTFICSCILLALCKEDVDYGTYTHRLSTKTAYRFVEPKTRSQAYPQCTATKIWSIIRHGTRTPGKLLTDLIENRLIHVRDLFTKYNKNSDLENWKPHVELDDKKRLTHEGEDEMIGLGERLRSRFPELLPEWNNNTYLFQHTDTERAKNSAEYFTMGLFGRHISRHVWYPSPVKKDIVLRFYKSCDKWKRDVKRNPSTHVESNKYKEGLVAEVAENVTKRFGLPEKSLNSSDMQLIYSTCGFETAWSKNTKSVWCDVLTEYEFEIMEYAKDLQYYWVDGYGYDLTTRIPCVTMKNALEHLTSSTDPSAVFYFTHSGTILKFLSYLGLYRDEERLLGDNFAQHRDRNWRTSKIDPFGANIAFVLFECNEGKHVLFLHDEQPVTLPGCPANQDLCPLDALKKQYGKSVEHCDFNEMCTIKQTGSVLQYVTSHMWDLVKLLDRFYF